MDLHVAGLTDLFTGKWEKIGEVDTHVTTPAKDYSKDKAILFLTYAKGVHNVNAEPLADDFGAWHGFKTYITPEYLHSEPIPSDVVDMTDVHLPQWVAKHRPDNTRSPLNKVIAVLKGQGVTNFGATGYCFGGQYVFDLAFDNTIKAAVVSHPALKLPSDLEVRFVMVNSLLDTGYKREYFKGCERDFAVRCDLEDETFKAGKQGVFKAVVG